ncbi:hypothetical protein THAOC_37135 [Thalassiosira oceanica]|uniref:DUF6824 domain-containing protein n=1 Tax=Thalassiosira oceanica TaxID=159749 RepID=K0R6Q4_THAOC|nr:hypothetical protein THAOC_37135 [Thalassiosira oceanica]|mmetsp:Transcript_7935/g.16956  ORF Transcript_7935/g.16956 Transcript_7935/m.16956 type:complete len:390 (-) Transcript_7935:39-1208(-)|eukprot:EJK44331.1 hypothetical protein THAOC_37135 [Thalassiosira oceanica]
MQYTMNSAGNAQQPQADSIPSKLIDMMPRDDAAVKHPQLSNYDVLLRTSGSGGDFVRPESIGNRRFRVTLSLYGGRYAAPSNSNENRHAVAREVIATVTDRCKGRFYEVQDNGSWEEMVMSSQRLIAIVERALSNGPSDYRPTTNTAATVRRHGALVEQAPARTLLRSLSAASVVSNSSHESTDQLPAHAQHRTATPTAAEAITIPAPFDVVCGPSGIADNNHTGNNRLAVLLSLRRDQYKSTNPNGRERIVHELTVTMIDDSSARFLRRMANGTYTVVGRDASTALIKDGLHLAAYGKRPTKRTASRKRGQNSEVSKLMDRRHKKQILSRLERRVTDNANGINESTAPTKLLHCPIQTKSVRGLESLSSARRVTFGELPKVMSFQVPV